MGPNHVHAGFGEATSERAKRQAQPMRRGLPMLLVSYPNERRPLAQIRSELPLGDAWSGPTDSPHSQDATRRCVWALPL